MSSFAAGSREAAHHREMGERRLFAARYDPELHAGPLTYRTEEVPPSRASRTALVAAPTKRSTPSARARAANSLMVSSVSTDVLGSSNPVRSTPRRRRVMRPRSRHRSLAIDADFDREHEDRVGADVERAQLHCEQSGGSQPFAAVSAATGSMDLFTIHSSIAASARVPIAIFFSRPRAPTPSGGIRP